MVAMYVVTWLWTDDGTGGDNDIVAGAVNDA
jgi:hypothetical protein